MAKPFMNCNYNNCGVALTKFAWITRCSHVFCDEHGELSFNKGGSRVRCPSCNEVKSRETDVIRNDLNPSDLVTSIIRPSKVLELAMHAASLWTYQMEFRRRCQADKIVRKYETITTESVIHVQTENKELKNHALGLEKKLKYVNDELFKMRAQLNRYKSAYHATRLPQHSDQASASFDLGAFETNNGGVTDFDIPPPQQTQFFLSSKF